MNVTVLAGCYDRTMVLKLYDFPWSGLSHHVRLFLSLLGQPHDRIMVDMGQGEHKDTEHLKLSLVGQVGTLVNGATVVTDSTATPVYLAIKSGDEKWLPRDAAGATRVQRWLSTAINRGRTSAIS